VSIICATDFSEHARKGAEVAAALALRFDEALVLVHAVSPAEMPESFALDGGQGLEAIEGAAEAALKLEAERLAATGARVESRVEMGTPEIVVRNASAAARMIVCGTRALKQPLRWLAGSTAGRLARNASAPVLVCHGDSEGILAWGRPPGRCACWLRLISTRRSVTEMELADSLLDGGPCELEFVHAPSRNSSREREFAQLAREERRVHLVEGAPDIAVPKLAREGAYDLLLVGTHARHGTERLWHPSISEKILHASPVPVAIARLGLTIRRHASAPLESPL